MNIIFRKKANVSLILNMSPNFQGCRDICPHALATLAEHSNREVDDASSILNGLVVKLFNIK